MARTVLGKRSRSAGGDGKHTQLTPPFVSQELTTPIGLNTGRPRAKRQAAIVIHSDADSACEENPFTTTPQRSTRSTRSSARKVTNTFPETSEDIENGEIAIKDISLNSPTSRRVTSSRSFAVEPAAAAAASLQIKKHFSTAKSSAPAQNDENIKLEPVASKITVAQVPSTPRRRDALSKQVPVTPRHRVAIGGFGTPRTPRTPSTPSQSTIYNVARQAFTRSSDPGMMVGREEERKELREFIEGCVESGKGGCTYVSGPPGTGKSATVSEIISQVSESASVKKAYVNCMSLKSSRDMSNLLLTTLLGDDADILESEAHQTLQGMFCPRKKVSGASQAGAPIYIITLDEIDHILTLDLEFLYQLFTWSMSPTSRLILLGIANALDLTDRLLPRLKARNLKPHLVPFLPYTSAQIKAVLTTRLESFMPKGTEKFIPFIHPAALELCSRKVAAQSGDLRKAFDIIRRSLDLIEAETKSKILSTITEANSPSKILSENVNLSTSAPLNLAAELNKLTPATAPRATIAHLNKITSAAFSNGLGSRLKTLNLQQKAALCSLLALERQKKEAAILQASFERAPSTPSRKDGAPSVKQLYDVYTRLCKQEAGLQPLTSTEFRDVVGSLETLSLVSGVDGRTGSFVGMGSMTPSSGRGGRKNMFGSGAGTGDEKRVGCCVGVKEVEGALEGVGSGILRGILNGSVDM